jgi:hypothetical protein
MRAEAARNDAVMVDSFTLEEYKESAVSPYPTLNVHAENLKEVPILN